MLRNAWLPFSIGLDFELLLYVFVLSSGLKLALSFYAKSTLFYVSPSFVELVPAFCGTKGRFGWKNPFEFSFSGIES